MSEGWTSEDFREHTDERKQRGIKNLAQANLAGFTRHSELHYSRTLLGDRMDYWPSRNRWRWRRKTMTGNVQQFITKRLLQ